MDVAFVNRLALRRRSGPLDPFGHGYLETPDLLAQTRLMHNTEAPVLTLRDARLTLKGATKEPA